MRDYTDYFFDLLRFAHIRVHQFKIYLGCSYLIVNKLFDFTSFSFLRNNNFYIRIQKRSCTIKMNYFALSLSAYSIKRYLLLSFYLFPLVLSIIRKLNKVPHSWREGLPQRQLEVLEDPKHCYLCFKLLVFHGLKRAFWIVVHRGFAFSANACLNSWSLTVLLLGFTTLLPWRLRGSNFQLVKFKHLITGNNFCQSL